jgi:hypothetical protein
LGGLRSAFGAEFVNKLGIFERGQQPDFGVADTASCDPAAAELVRLTASIARHSSVSAAWVIRIHRSPNARRASFSSARTARKPSTPGSGRNSIM